MRSAAAETLTLTLCYENVASQGRSGAESAAGYQPRATPGVSIERPCGRPEMAQGSSALSGQQITLHTEPAREAGAEGCKTKTDAALTAPPRSSKFAPAGRLLPCLRHLGVHTARMRRG